MSGPRAPSRALPSKAPPSSASEYSINGVAMMFHELTTNAAKYGALREDEGKVSIRWQKHGDHLDFHWLERGGPKISAAPKSTGFGSKLLQDMVARQFHGTFEHQWNPEGAGSTHQPSRRQPDAPIEPNRPRDNRSPAHRFCMPALRPKRRSGLGRPGRRANPGAPLHRLSCRGRPAGRRPARHHL